MGEVRENITLKNAYDVMACRRGVIPEREVRQMVVEAVADTGAWTLILTEETRRKLGLEFTKTHAVTVAGGEKKSCMVADPVEVTWKDRYVTIDPIVLPGEQDVLLGALPLEAMDVLVDPVRRCLSGAHGDTWTHYVR